MRKRTFQKWVTSQTTTSSQREIGTRASRLTVGAVNRTLVKANTIRTRRTAPGLILAVDPDRRARHSVMLTLIKALEGVRGRIVSSFCNEIMVSIGSNCDRKEECLTHTCRQRSTRSSGERRERRGTPYVSHPHILVPTTLESTQALTLVDLAKADVFQLLEDSPDIVTRGKRVLRIHDRSKVISNQVCNHSTSDRFNP